MRLVAAVVAGAVAFGATLAARGGGETVPPRPPDPRGAALFAKMGCGSCHFYAPAEAQGSIAPGLSGLLDGHTRASLAAVIARPPSFMPPDYGERMTEAELDLLAGWLLATRRR